MTDRIGSPTWISHPTAEDRSEDEAATAGTRPLEWYYDKAKIEAACFAFPCEIALEISKCEMPDGGLAERTLDHFLDGSTEAMHVDLDRELEKNPELRERLASRIERALAEDVADSPDALHASGAIWISQQDYGSGELANDLRYSLGGTFVEYQAVGSAAAGGLEVELDVSDHYFWSPSDSTRVTQCLHECASQMVAAGEATEFYQYGEGSLVVGDPRTSDPIPEPRLENRGAR